MAFQADAFQSAGFQDAGNVYGESLSLSLSAIIADGSSLTGLNSISLAASPLVDESALIVAENAIALDLAAATGLSETDSNGTGQNYDDGISISAAALIAAKFSIKPVIARFRPTSMYLSKRYKAVALLDKDIEDWFFSSE